MEAGVVAGHPADQPDLHLVVEAQALEDALRGLVADEVRPRLGVRRERGDDLAQLGALERGGAGWLIYGGKQSAECLPDLCRIAKCGGHVVDESGRRERIRTR